MEHESKRQPLSTREENGMRVSTVNPALRFPTDASLREALDALNDTARDHKLKPCETGDDCEMCFLAEASTSSKVFVSIAKQYMEQTLGPMIALVDPKQMFSLMFFFYMLASKIERRSSSGTFKAEIDELEKLFNTQPSGSYTTPQFCAACGDPTSLCVCLPTQAKDNSTGEVPSNPS